MIEEKDLLLRISNNDELAFMSFFDLYHKRIFNFIFKFLKDITESEDLTQIIFIKIWEKRALMSTINSVDGFIFTVAHRIVIDYFRSKNTKHKKNIQFDHPNDEQISTLSSDDLMKRHEFELIYNKAIDLLPKKRKEVFVLSKHEGLSNKEIAKRLNISVKTVENQMTSALFSLKNYLKQFDFISLIFFIIIKCINRG